MWVQLYQDGSAPDYAETGEECTRIALARGLDGARGQLRAVADAEVDEDLAVELARWATGDVLALSAAVLTARLPDLSDAEVRAALDGEARGKGRRDALAAIATEIRRRGL